MQILHSLQLLWLLWRYVWIILEQLWGNNVKKGKKWRCSQKYVSCACSHVFEYKVSCIQCFYDMGAQAGLDSMCSLFKILTMPQQQRVSSCFIYLIQFLPCRVCVTDTKVFWWRRAFVCKHRHFWASPCCTALSQMLLVCQTRGKVITECRFVYMCVCVVVQSWFNFQMLHKSICLISKLKLELNY